MATTIKRTPTEVVTRFYGGHAFGQLVEVYHPVTRETVIRFPTDEERCAEAVYTD
jgi:hypothetical protein